MTTPNETGTFPLPNGTHGTAADAAAKWREACEAQRVIVLRESDAEADRILAMTDAEIEADCRARGVDIDKAAAGTKRFMLNVVELVRLRADLARVTAERDALDAASGDWTGKKCTVCAGTGEVQDAAKCGPCGGTGDEYRTWRNLVAEHEATIARLTADRDAALERAFTAERSSENLNAIADGHAATIRTQGETIARLSRELDEARADLAKVKDKYFAGIGLGLVDPTRWRGPHGEPREDDDHRWREAVVAGKRVLLRCYFDTERTASVDKFWAEGPDAYFRTIDAACDAADK